MTDIVGIAAQGYEKRHKMEMRLQFGNKKKSENKSSLNKKDKNENSSSVR